METKQKLPMTAMYVPPFSSVVHISIVSNLMENSFTSGEPEGYAIDTDEFDW